MVEAVSRLARMLSQRGDLVVALIVLTAIVMMIIPLPTAVVDVVITLNIATAVLILLVAFYIITPTQFSSLPSVILLSTLFRLAITITTTRLILLQGDAGQVVQAFGEFVIGGNVAVGLVIFFIITIAQFVVITKGGERVAEVAARFSLDALPGKQMSIDNELRNGDITHAEARRLRQELERESHLYGAMDGAMKFVKGDAIAGLVIIFVNLLGGLTVGMAQQGMDFSTAVATFSLLTVGDGLVAQIPALLVSIAAGTVVTRVASEHKRDLGSEITGQLINDQRALYLASAILGGLAFIPGFPAYIFLLLAAALAGIGLFVQRRRAAEPQVEAIEPAVATSAGQALQERASAADDQRIGVGPRVVLRVGSKLAALPSAAFANQIDAVRQDVHQDLGVNVPRVDLRGDEKADPNGFFIELENVPVVEGSIFADRLMIEGDGVHLELANIPHERAPALIGRQEAIWVPVAYQSRLTEVGISFLTPAQILAKCLKQMLYRYATHFIGIQETRTLLASAETDYAELVREAQNVANTQKIAEILRRLVEENVPIGNLRQILEALVEWGPREKDTVLLGEYVRMALGRQICFRVADHNRVIAAYVLERSVEEVLRAGVRPTNVGTFLNISEEAARPIIEQFRRLLQAAKPEVSPVVLCAMDVRRHLRNLLIRNDIEISVLSYQELAPEFSVQPLATILSNSGSAAPERPSVPDHVESRGTPQTVRG
ncbi:MAG: type III secretion system export apparatus subunit SctV [Rhodomicrobiaceae bacterium]